MRRRAGRTLSAIFAGDPRVWRGAALVAVPVFALVAFWCLKPRDYYTGTDSVEPLTYVAPVPPGGHVVCVHGLLIPPGTTRVQMQVISKTTRRPAIDAVFTDGSRVDRQHLPPVDVGPSRASDVVLGLPPAFRPGSPTLCLQAKGEVNWAGLPVPTPPTLYRVTLDGAPLPAALSIWYLPEPGAQSSYLSRLPTILDRAALFRPGFVGAWLYWLMLFGVLPALAYLALRLAALAAAHERVPIVPRRFALALYAIAVVNFACWALVTPAFQAPDEVDHFAYTQSLVERGEKPAESPASPLPRWARSEGLLLEKGGFATDHQTATSRVPWDQRVQRRWERAVEAERPSASDGGGYSPAAPHGPLYYGALAPAYAIASSSPLAQLTLMRLTSALIGALSVLFAFLLGRELAPRRPLLGVLAALLVAFQPMYGFISGAVNNDVGVNAAAAALQLLTILVLRRGWRMRLVVPLGVLLLATPAIKETGLSIYPLVGLALLVALWRHRPRGRPEQAAVAVLAATAIVTGVLIGRLKAAVRPAAVAVAGAGATAVTAGSSVSEALHHPLGYLSYLWEVFLPRLGFMAPHFVNPSTPAFLIYVERGFGAFGWYDVLFPKWVFYTVFAVMMCVVLMALASAYRERAYLLANVPETAFLLLCPVAVVAGVEAAFYTAGVRPLVAEFGRYAFPAIVPLALIVVGSLHAFGRRWVPWLGAGLLTAMIGLCVAGQLLTLAGFYA